MGRCAWCGASVDSGDNCPNACGVGAVVNARGPCYGCQVLEARVKEQADEIERLRVDGPRIKTASGDRTMREALQEQFELHQQAEARVRALEAENAKLNSETWKGHLTIEEGERLQKELDLIRAGGEKLLKEAEARVARLTLAGRGMLLSADATWTGGHDWIEACEAMRAALGEGR